MTEKEFVEFLSASFGLLAGNSKPGSVHFACMDWRHAGEILAAGKHTYDAVLNVCVWAKDKGGMGSFYRSQHELIFVFGTAKLPIATTSNSANLAAIAPMSGNTQG
jgi:hypothetical protein